MQTSHSSISKGRAARGYAQVHRSAQIDGASPHELIRLMLNGAMASVNAASTLDPNVPGDREARHRTIDRALAFVHELQGSLHDPENNALSGRLFSLYGFVTTQLLEATTENDSQKLYIARDVLAPIVDAWSRIGPAVAFGEGEAPSRAA